MTDYTEPAPRNWPGHGPDDEITDEEIKAAEDAFAKKMRQRDRELDAIPDPDDEFHRKLEDKAILEAERE